MKDMRAGCCFVSVGLCLCCCYISSYLVRVMVMVDEGRVIVDDGRVIMDDGIVMVDEGKVMGGGWWC